METSQKLKDIGVVLGTVLGYITILIGIVMTVLLFEAIYSGI